MQRIQDFSFNNIDYEIYLSNQTQALANEIGIHEGIFLGTVARLINRVNKKENTFYHKEKNLLFHIEAEEPNKFFFISIRQLQSILKSPDTLLSMIPKEVKLLRTNNDHDVFIHEDLHFSLKKNKAISHLLNSKSFIVDKDGQHSMFKNETIIDYITCKGNIHITNVLTPDFINYSTTKQ